MAFGDSEKDDASTGNSPQNNDTAVENMRKRFKELTRSIINHQSTTSQSTVNTSSAAAASNDNSSSSSASSSSSSQPSNPTDTSNSNNQQPNLNEWDEICLGIWIQDKLGRKYDIGGKCHGISIIRSDNPEGKIQHMRPTRAYLHLVLFSRKSSTVTSNNRNETNSHTSNEETSKLKDERQQLTERMEKIAHKQLEIVQKLFEREHFEKTWDFANRVAVKALNNAGKVLNEGADRLNDLWNEWKRR